MKPENDRKKTWNRNAEPVCFIALTALIGIAYALFYRHYVPFSWDCGYHTLFAEKLFHQSLESMAAEDPNIPIHAVTYPLYHLSLKLLAFLMGNRYYAASYCLLGASIAAAVALLRVFLLRVASPANEKEKIFLDLISLCSVVFVTARGPLTEWRYYARQCAANPVHNPTIIFVRPIGILTILAFLLFLERFEKKESYWRELVLFGGASFLSVLAKPSFALVFLLAMAVIVLEQMIRSRSLKIGFAALAAALPSAALMLWQIVVVKDETAAMEVVVRFGSFAEFTPLEVLCVSLATFPVPLLLFSPKIFGKERTYRLAYYALAIGWLQMFFLSNGSSGDFSWGYDLAVQFSTVIALALSQKHRLPLWRRTLALAVFIYQVACGVAYLVLVGQSFEIMI